jgi:hypothetical protein
MKKWILPIILMELFLSFSFLIGPINVFSVKLLDYTIAFVNDGNWFMGLWTNSHLPFIAVGFYNDWFPFLQINLNGNIFILSL